VKLSEASHIHPGAYTGESSRRSGKRPVATDFVDTFDHEQLAESSAKASAHPSELLVDETKSGQSTPTATQSARSGEPNFHKVSIIRRCVIDFSDEEEDIPDSEKILSDIALVKAKEEEIRKLRERIEKYRGKQRAEVNALSAGLVTWIDFRASRLRAFTQPNRTRVFRRKVGRGVRVMVSFSPSYRER
jgi:hypothetical protein